MFIDTTNEWDMFIGHHCLVGGLRGINGSPNQPETCAATAVKNFHLSCVTSTLKALTPR